MASFWLYVERNEKAVALKKVCIVMKNKNQFVEIVLNIQRSLLWNDRSSKLSSTSTEWHQSELFDSIAQREKLYVYNERGDKTSCEANMERDWRICTQKQVH